MPTPTQIIPYIFYRDVSAALDWLTRTFGFKEELRTGTPKGGMHGEMSFHGQLIMMGPTGAPTPLAISMAIPGSSRRRPSKSMLRYSGRNA